MGFKDVTEDNVAKCVKTFVMGMRDEDQQESEVWAEKHEKASHDHSAADLATALTQKTYSASFETEVMEDLEQKSSSLSSERDELSFVGTVGMTTMEVMIKMLEIQASSLITASWESLSNIDRSYYEEE